MKSTVFQRGFLIPAILVLSVFICFGQDDPADKLLGTWIKVADMGTITLTFKSDNISEVEFNGDEVIDVYSNYEISGTKITFNDYDGDYAADVPGSYEFKVEAASLTFTPVDDPVPGRSMLVQGTWSREPESQL